MQGSPPGKGPQRANQEEALSTTPPVSPSGQSLPCAGQPACHHGGTDGVSRTHYAQNFYFCCSVIPSRPTLCDPTDRSTPGLPVCHRLPESTQTHVQQVGDAIQPSSSVVPFSSHLQSFPASGSFPRRPALRIRWPRYWSFSFSIRPSKECLGLTSFRMDWLDLLALCIRWPEYWNFSFSISPSN